MKQLTACLSLYDFFFLFLIKKRGKERSCAQYSAVGPNSPPSKPVPSPLPLILWVFPILFLLDTILLLITQLVKHRFIKTSYLLLPSLSTNIFSVVCFQGTVLILAGMSGLVEFASASIKEMRLVLAVSC